MRPPVIRRRLALGAVLASTCLLPAVAAAQALAAAPLSATERDVVHAVDAHNAEALALLTAS